MGPAGVEPKGSENIEKHAQELIQINPCYYGCVTASQIVVKMIKFTVETIQQGMTETLKQQKTMKIEHLRQSQRLDHQEIVDQICTVKFSYAEHEPVFQKVNLKNIGHRELIVVNLDEMDKESSELEGINLEFFKSLVKHLSKIDLYLFFEKGLARDWRIGTLIKRLSAVDDIQQFSIKNDNFNRKICCITEKGVQETDLVNQYVLVSDFSTVRHRKSSSQTIIRFVKAIDSIIRHYKVEGGSV